MISFIIPAHNEERLIGRTLAAIHEAAGGLGVDYEIVVADDASTDASANIAASHGANVVSVDYRQISRTRNAGAKAAKGDILMFVDADTIVNGDAVRAAIDAIHNGAVGGGCVVQFDGTIPLYARLTLPILILSFRILKLAAGCFIFCRRNAFERVGGFSEEIYASEEVWLSRALAREGQFVILRESVTTSGRKVRTHSVWEVIGVGLRAMMFWRRPLKQRSGLELWYGPRRADPEDEAGSPDDAADASSR
jgi:glycosyltransferase involved in cell wall biosynthesis